MVQRPSSDRGFWKAAYDGIRDRYPDDVRSRGIACNVIHQVRSYGESTLDELAAELSKAREAERSAMVALREAALLLVTPNGKMSRREFARRVGVDTKTVRRFLA